MSWYNSCLCTQVTYNTVSDTGYLHGSLHETFWLKLGHESLCRSISPTSSIIESCCVRLYRILSTTYLSDSRVSNKRLRSLASIYRTFQSKYAYQWDLANRGLTGFRYAI